MTSRKPSAALLTIGILLAFATTAPAVTLMVNGDTPSVRFQAWADQSRMPTPRGIVNLMLTPCPDPPVEHADGCARSDLAPPTIWLAPDWATVARSTEAHELGHVFDHMYLTAGDHNRFRRIWRRPSIGWFNELAPIRPGDPWAGGDGSEGRSSAAGEWFADAYQACALHRIDRSDSTVGTYLIYISDGPRDSLVVANRLAATCVLIRHVGLREGLVQEASRGS